MNEDISNVIKDHNEAVLRIPKKTVHNIELAVTSICKAFKNGNKLMIFGNGGSAADAQHIAAEFVNKFKLDREPLPAIAITTDASILTAIGNDDGFEYIFQKQIKALGRKGDIILVLTTSDFQYPCLHSHHSANLCRGLEVAKEKGMTAIGLVSEASKTILDFLDIAIVAPSKSTPRIQELHVLFYHIICELVECGLSNDE